MSRKPNNRGLRTDATCGHCRASFRVRLKAQREGKGRFCSVGCAFAARKIDRTLACTNCAAPFLASDQQHRRARRGSRPFCDTPACQFAKASERSLKTGAFSNIRRAALADIVANRRMIAAIQEQLHHG